MTTSRGLAVVVLAAGEGRRLRPLTDLRPKPLCPVGGRPLLDWALDRVEPWGAGSEQVAVNAHHLGEQVVEHVGARARVSAESALLGTAGALGALSDWIAGRDVLLTNSDALLVGPDPQAASAAHVLAPLMERPMGPGPRLLVTRPGPTHPMDFPDPDDTRGWRYVGACLLPGPVVAGFPAEPGGLMSLAWAPALAEGTLEFAELVGTHIDCGTPADYLSANLLISGGTTLIGAGARVDGEALECVIWDGAVVERGERLRRCIRAEGPDGPVTVQA